MGRHRPITLQTFIYRTLSIRLGVIAIIIGLLTSAVVYLVEGQNLRNLVVEETRTEVQLLVLRTVQIAKEQGGYSRAAFLQALNERLSVQLRRENGSFVYVSFREMKNQDFLERMDTKYPLIDSVVKFVRSHPIPETATGEWSEIITIGGKMHVNVVMPIENLSEQKVGYSQAIFVPSETVLINMQKGLRRSVELALLIVFATSALLYPVILHLVRKLAIFSRNLLDANLETLSLLASTIAKRDSDTDVHNFRVTLYSVRLAEALQLPDNEIQTLIKGAFLHDVGKIGVRDNILLKPGGLDEGEFTLMKEHVRHGLDIISGSVWLRDAALVVGSHHEKFDGSGYPEGKTGEEIPLLARIFAIADVFDALTSKRPYKEPFSFEESTAALQKGRGSHFDSKVLDVFTAISQELYCSYAGRDDQGLRDELKGAIAKYFSKGDILLY